MADIFDKAKRSQVMACIKGAGNRSTEMALIRLMKEHGITGWRRGQPLFGKPDFVFREARVAVFVDGCFWHACPKHCRPPSSNREFWDRKLLTNRIRDKLVNRTLRRKGWRVMRVWEHALRKPNQAALVRRLRRAIAFDADPG